MNTRINGYGYEILRNKTRDRHEIKYHTVAAEMMFGGPIPEGLVVHHIDKDKLNNDPKNLMICSIAYHNIIHSRLDAIEACGISWYRPCAFCGTHDNPTIMVKTDSAAYYHSGCRSAYDKQRVRVRKKA